MSGDARERVAAAARELDYHIDRTASRLATGRTETVGVVVPDLNTWYFSGVLSGIEATLAEATYDVLVMSVHDEAARGRLASGNAPLHKRVDALIFIDVLLSDPEVRELRRAPLHVVTVGQQTRSFPSVTIDNRDAARTVTQHLVNLGHRRIGFVSGEPDIALRFSVPEERRAGFTSALGGAGLRVDNDIVIRTGSRAQDGAAAAATMMATPEPPTAIVAATDELAFGVLSTLSNLGYRVPNDISVAGFDDRELSESVGLTTVAHDPQLQGRLAAELVLGASVGDDEAKATHLTADARLVVRSTTARPPTRPRSDAD